MSKYTLEYIQSALENSSAPKGEDLTQKTKYTQEYVQRVLDQQKSGAAQSPAGGPLQITKGGGGQTAAPAVQDTAPAVQSPLEQLFGPRLDPQQQQTMRQAIAATKPAAAPAQTGISADVLLPYRQIGERGAAARQVDENLQLKLLGTPARHGGRQVPGKAPAAQSAAPAVSATWRANAGMDAQQAPAWQQEAQQQRQSAAQGAPARQMNAGMGTSATPRQQESESQRRRREARQRALQLNKAALESGASTLDTKSALVELRMRQQQAAYEAQEQAARTERNPAGSLYAPGNTLLGTVQRSGEGLRGQELKNEAAQALAEMTGPEEYLAKDKLSELEKQAALLLLNRYKEENPGELDQYDALPEQERAEADQWLALEYKLGSFTSAMDRLAKGARSMQYNLVGTPDVIGKTAQQAAKDTVADWHDPEWSALADQLVQIDRQMMIREELGGAKDQKLQELKAQRAAIQQQMDAVAQKTPLDLDTYGARTMLLGQDMNRQAQTGLSPAGKTAYSVGYSVADNLAVLPLNFIPGVGQAAALGVQGAKAGAQEMLELAQRGVGAEEAFARGAIAGGIEAGTEKIGMDNLVDIVGKGGKQALNSLLKKQLTELAAKGGQSAGASAAAALLSNATAEGLEEAVGYIANYAADQLFGDPESEFSLEEFLASAGQGAAAGLILGGGGMAVNALLGGTTGAAGGENAALQPNATPEAQPEIPALAETYQVLAGLDNSPASRAKGAIMALDVELAQNLAQQEQLKMRVQLLTPDPTKITAVQKAWGEMAKLMDAESKIRLQKEVFQRQAEIGTEAVKAAREGNATATTELPTLMEQLFDPTAAPQQSKPREPSLVEQLLPEHYDPGVTIGRGVKADRTAFAQVDRAARALNRPVVVESLPQGHNGYYKDGVIHISAESQSPVMNVFTHELTHHLETSGEYAALAEHVRASEAMQSFLQATDMTMEEYRSFLKDSYARMGIRLDGKAVDAEIVANFCEKFLFKDENSVRRLCGEKPGLGRRILDFIRQLLGKLRGDEAAELRQAERLFVNALSGAQAENAGTGPQLSVQGSAHPQANSGGAGAVSYEALTALPDMRLTQISTALPEGMGIGDAARLGVENSRQPGMKNGRVTNRYTGQEIQITAEGLRHGMTRKTRLQKNGPYALRAGEILQNAVKVNELAPRGNEVRTDIYLGGAIDENGSVHGVRFLVKLYESGHQTADLGDMEVYSGSLYAHTGTKIGTAALRAPEVSNQIATPTVPIIRIADLLGTVKGKMDTFLSESVKENIGAVPGKSVEFGDSQLYSVTPQLTPQEWKQGRRTTAAGMEKGTVAPKVPEVSGKAATPTVPASTIAGARGKVKPGKAVDAENTVVNDDPAAHTAQEQRLIEAYKAAVDPGLARFYERVKAGQYDGRPYVVGRVTDEAARAMEQLTGKQVQGNLVVLDDNGVQHIERRHGKNGEADHSMANLEDIARINFVLENFDQAYRSEQPAAGYFDSKGKKAPVVVFTKKINGTYYVVEAVSDAKSKRNYIISAYLSREGGKKTAPAQRPLDVQAPKSRPKPEIADTGATYSIPTGGRDVNASDGRDPYDLASLFRSDPKRAAVDEAAQARAQQRLQNTPITEEERQARLQGTTGDTVRDTFALHPITEPVNFGMDAESIRAAEQEIRQLKRELGRAERNPYRPGGDATTVEKADAQQVAQGEKTMQQLSAGSRPDVVAELAHLQARLDEAKQYGLSYQKRSIFEHQQTLLRAALDGINDPEALAGKNINIAELNRRTPERAFRRVFGEQKGAELAEMVIKPVHQNESAKVQFINKLFDQARALDLNEVERKLVQLVGERAAGKGQKSVTIGDIQSRSITDEMLPGSMDIKERRFILQNLAKADPAKVEKAVGWYKQIYKSLWEVVNDFRMEHGMAEIGWQEDYFPHFNEDDPLTKTLKQLGIEGASGLPTSIAGQTAWFRPNSRYVPFFQQRKGIATSYDSDLGFQSYLTAVADMLYHTDDIMRLRNLDSVLRGKRTELDVGNVVDSILGKKNLEVNAQEAELIEKVLTGEYMDMEAAKNYNTFAQWLTNYTNKLANKQLFGDRSFEEHYGRTAFNIASKIESAFARNSTVGNLSTALNNTITLPKVLATTPQKYVAQAVKGLVSGEFKTSGLAQESEFLLGKRGVRPLVESRTRRVARMISNVTFEPVEAAVSDIAFYAKYLHGLGIGATQSEAIETANDYAAYMMARRSKGARPLALETKDPFHKLFTLFQTEVSNDFFSLRDDLPAYLKRVEAQRGKAAASKQLAMGAAKYCVYSSALNALLENLTGYAPAPDPLRWLWEFMEALLDRDEEEEDTLAKGVQRVGGAVGGLAGNVLNQVPGASTAMALAGFGEGRVPLPNLDKDRIINAGEAAFADPEENPNKWGYVREQLWKGVGVPALTTLFPFGGNQLRKTLEGTKVMGQGAMYSESKDGQKLQTAVQNDPFTLQGASNWLKAAAFGKSAIREVGDYYDNGGKPKSASYTEAYKEGYDPYDLDQLFPGSGKGAGKVTYEQLTGGAKGAAEVDNWLTELMRYQDNLAMLPSNSTTSVTVDGETVKLTGSKAMEFAQTKAETSYNILETLLPTADRYDRSVQEKYAVRAQDYAHAVAKEEVLGVEPAEGSWIEKVQTYSGAEGAELNDRLVNALLGSSIVAEATADYYPNGRPIEGSRKRKAIAALKEAGFDTKTALQMWEVFN